MQLKRHARSPGQQGTPWTKARIQYEGREIGRIDREERFRRQVEQRADAAALVQTIRDCYEDGKPPPAWASEALEDWLTDFVNLARARRAGRWTKWARQWLRLHLDFLISDHIAANREAYGLTWDEARDETADFFAGTLAAGSSDAMNAAHKRHVRRGPKRPITYWEISVEKAIGLGLRPHRKGSPKT